MSSENNPVSSSSSPIGNSTENTQQDWMDLDQQGVAGETLKAKKWTTQRRLVDDASYQGNIHTGTEATTELNKSDTLSGDALNYQSIANEGKETQDNNGPEEFSDESQRGLSPDMDSLNRTDTPSATSAAYEHTTEAESLVTSSGSDTLKFEEHIDEAKSHGRTATENKSTTRLAQPAATETPPEDLPLENSSQERNTATVSELQQKSEISDAVDPSTQTPTTAPGSAPEPVPDHEIITESSASAPILTTADAIGVEDTMIAIDISSQLTDTDGSESLAITIGGVPEGAFLSAGTSLGNGEWQLTPDQLENLSLTPPANSDEDFSLTVTATSTESHGGQQNSRSEIIDFFIEAVPDTPELTTVAATGTEDTAITLDISTALTELDGSEILSAITLSGLPEGSIVSAGTQNIDGSWSVAQDDLEGLQLTPPKDYSDNFEINLSVTATDSNGSTSTSTAVLPVTITAAPDEAVISGSGAILAEDTLQTASGQLTVVDPDADEAHFTAETIEGTYGFLDVATDGSWTYNLNNDADTVQQLGTGDTVTDTLTVTSADGSTHDLVMTITGTNDAISVVSDSNTAPNTIMENAADGTEIHLSGLATDADGDAILYTLVDDQGNEITNGPFSINRESGVVTLQDRSLIDYETESSHTLHIQASSADGTSSTSDFQVQIEDVDIIKTTDLGGDVNGTAVTFTVTGDHYDPKNIQDVGAGSPHYRIRVNGEPLEIDGQNTFSVEANRGHIEDNHVVRDGNDVELVTFRVPQGTDVDSVSIEFINDAYDTSSDRDGDGITTEDRNLVVKELNIGGTVNDDGSIDGGTTLQAEDIEVSQYIASNGADVSGREVMPWQGSMTFYPDGVPQEAPILVDDNANISEDSAVVLTGNILSNDTDANNGSNFSVTGLSGVTVLQDNFDDGNADGWVEISSNGADTDRWQVVDGAIGEKSNSAKGIMAHDMGDSADSTNYEVSVDIHANAGDTYNNNVGLTFGYEDNANYYMIKWDDYSDNYSESSTHKDFQLIKVEDGHQTIIDQIDHAELPSDFTLSVNVSNDSGISISVDGEEKLRAADEHPAINTIGLNTGDNDSGISYDNVSVINNDIPIEDTTSIDGTYGTLTLNQDGSYSYELNDANNDVQMLHDGEQLTETFAVNVLENHSGEAGTETLNITINGSNDGPVAINDSTVSELATVFQDDFNDGNTDGWTEISYNDADTGNWQAVDGAIGERSNSARGIMAHNMGDDAESTNFEVSVDVHANSGQTGNNNVGITFGYEDNSNYYMVKWDDYSENYSESSTHKDFQLIKVENGHQTIIDQIDQADLPSDFNLSVNVSDDNGIAIMVDGKEMLTAVDEHPAINTIGLNTDDNDGGISYDNVSVKVASDQTIVTDEDSSIVVTADSLLANDTDVEGDTLSISAVSENVLDVDGNIVGTASQDDSGNIVFTPGDALDALAEGESTNVNFTYTVSDGQGGTDTATATITVTGKDNDLTYVSESAGYKNVVGMYETDDQGNPVSGTVIIDDQNGMAGGTHLADLEPGNYEFFIIANGANEVDTESSISFDTSGDKPILLIDGEPAAHPVYFTEPGFNPDGKDHFHFESDGEGGTFIKIEDLPDLGDADFEDVVLHTNFEMDDRTASGELSDGDQAANSVVENTAPEAIADIADIKAFELPEGGSIVSTESNTIVVKGEIVTEGDTGSSVDQWTFHHGGGPLTIDTLSESGTNFTDIDGDGAKNHIDTMMRLYDEDGNQVAMNDDSSMQTGDGSTNDYFSHIQDSYIQVDDLPPGNYSLAIGSWELTQDEVANGHNDNSDQNIRYDHAQDTGPYQITLTGDVSFSEESPLATDEDTGLTINADTLLANDSDVDGDSLSIVAVGTPVDADGKVVGTTELVTENGEQQIRFVPGAQLDSLETGESSSVSFSYTIDDGQGGTDTATATITVAGTDNDLTYVSESAGYKNVVGMYETDDQGNPVSGTVIIDDQNGMAGGTHLADLEPGNHEFFIIANGANEVDAESSISFDTSGNKPILLIDGEPATHPVYFTEPGFNPDGKDHFHFESDGEGGTFIKIEDLPDLGDADFEDVVLHTNFAMDDRTIVEESILDEQLNNSIATGIATAGFDTSITDTEANGIHSEAMEDLSLNMPFLTLPGDAEGSEQAAEPQETAIVTQDTVLQADTPVSESFTEDSQQSLNPPTDDDLALSLPSISLNDLFDEPADNNYDPAVTTENETSAVSNTDENTNPANEAATDTTDETSTTEAVGQEPQEELVDDATDLHSIAGSEVEETELNTDNLHIDLASDTESESSTNSEDESSSLDRFAATSANASEDNDNSPLDNFSACSQSEETSEFSSVEEIDTIDDNATDQVDDAGLNDVNAIQEDLSQEAEQVDANGAC